MSETDDHAGVDPVDVLEELLAASDSNDPAAALQVVQAGLAAIESNANHDTLARLAAEDDADERAELLDHLAFQRERLVEAHRRYERHLTACAFARASGPIPARPPARCAGRQATRSRTRR